MSIYNFTVNNIEGEEVSLEKYKGKAVLIVNTASKCGFTPQYEDLQKLYTKYNNYGFEILAFPCNQFMNQEFEENKEIKSFCTLEYGVTFPMFDKINVNGNLAHPLFKYLKDNAPFKGFDMNIPTNKILDSMIKEKFPAFTIGNSIRWNFTKFLLDKKGNIIERFESSVSPMDIEPRLKEIL